MSTAPSVASARGRSSDEEASALVLRLFFLLIAVGVAVAAVMVSLPEWQQVLASRRATYHFGDAPSLALLLPSALALVGVVVFAGLLALRRRAPLWLVAGAVVAGGVTCVVYAAAPVPAGRSWAAADVAILKVGQRLREAMHTRMMAQGKLPADDAQWQTVLTAVAEGSSPARDAAFRALPYTFVRQPDHDRLVAPLVPGQLQVWISADLGAFAITPVGFDRAGTVAVLEDEKGKPLVLDAELPPENP